MTHLLPPHADLNIAHSSLQSALQIDPNQQQPPPPQQLAPPQQPPAQPPSRKRRKADTNGDEAPHPAEPRRLRRSHEACARCRSKKIKCDSKHPRCTACATAGTPCHQEDRHRQTLTPRGHTERIERQLLQCDALLKRHIPGFNLDNIDDVCAREGIEIDSVDQTVSTNFQFAQSPQPGTSNRPYPLRTEVPQPPPGGSPPRPYPYGPPPGQPMMPHGYPAPMPMHYGPPGSPYGPPPHMPMQGPPPPGYNPHIMPPFQHPLHPHPAMQPRPPSSHDIKGQDPLSYDMTSTQALAKSFGVHTSIVNEVRLPVVDKEDLAVGSSGLSSGRDRDIPEPSVPLDVSKWVSVSMRRNSGASQAPPSTSPTITNPPPTTVAVWLPKDRMMVRHILDVYFSRLNFHRPVFARTDFEQTLDALYDGQVMQDDPGYVCSVYLILALGTLSELNHRVSGLEKDGNQLTSPTTPKKLMPPDWPEHEEFFARALAVKPDLRVTVSSLQALILLQWYLYTERQGRTLWRLVGSLVRLAIELGLHHDPTSQDNVFSEEECQLRIRLWGIVLLHDRGTSILLGRPLAIAPSDSNTPRPSRAKSGNSDVSEHFVISAPIAEIQADIINSLYAPTRQSADAIMRHATRIIKSMGEFRRQLPENYKSFFGGTDDWPLERRTKLVQDITEDQGLTLLKIGITRILLLRALFSSKELQYPHRHRALTDAIVTAHNIIIVHNQLIRFPDIAFFVSPIPLHISAMVILYGRMSRCDPIPRQVALEDVWMALDMLPSFRWRWERKDLNGGHPLIAKVAEKVLNVNLHQVAPTAAPMLLSEQDWETDVLSPTPGIAGLQQQGPQPTTPTIGSVQYPGLPGAYIGPGSSGGSSGKGSPGRAGGGLNAGPSTPVDKKLAEVPAALFYPFYPENQNVATNAAVVAAAGNGGNQDFNHLLAAAAAAQQMGTFGYQASQEAYMLEEKDTSIAPSVGTQMWMNGHEQRPMAQFPMQTQP
ncbi:fungal-specific transcription factor domain-containing protein [Amylocystis lapponica]|nr:fungal-specific transcription factor domain-containing protein [Amylocystis lapponica]